MKIKIVETEGITEAINEAVTVFFSGDRRAAEENFLGHKEGNSSTLFGYKNSELVGILTIRWKSRNPFLREANIPLFQNIEIRSDLRGRGHGGELMAKAEDFVSSRSDRVAICVSLSEAYGPAQRLYAKRGFIPDGRGFTKVTEPGIAGEMATVEPLR